ncbi:cyclic AMP-responsive element-binding protein 3-like protein 3-A [Neoarius graeffei]|uniref:cyclic AMP-responsive element-binding protein 3-like protein 3-A n=1 Tax=Neoarius graeffei TaxID=443677 RepID=UPI00298C236D|nr:cyclic AMP-responsive element-binding protein 3-like protein 3-A [Neoarius graeffei]
MNNVEFNGSKLRIYPDMSAALAKKRAAFKDVKQLLYVKNSFNGVELLDLLFEQADENSVPEEPEGVHVNLARPFPDQSLPSHSGDEADHFLGSLLNVCKCVSGSSSPLWAPSPCDSGISDDPLSDHLDSPPPSSNLLFDSFFISQHQHPHPLSPPPLHPPQQSQQQQQQPPPPRLVSSSADQEISIDVEACESNLSLYSLMVPQCMPTVDLSSDASSVFQLSVKDLLLSNFGEPPKQPSASQNLLQELVLNDDEKKLLAKEGVSLPSQLPLTKYEEKILKKIRRKIRNKQSAQESRKKKKEYLDGLEGRMAACSAQNMELQKKVAQLEKTNTSLMEQLRRLQALVINSANKPAQTGVCILVLLLSFSLILFPRFQPLSHSRISDPADLITDKVQSRSLRSVVEVHSLQPVSSMDRHMETTTNIISKTHIRPEYADMDPLHHNRSYGDQEHHHGDPITGHTAMLGWHNSRPCNQKDKK